MQSQRAMGAPGCRPNNSSANQPSRSAPGLSRQLSLFERTAKRRYFASSNPRARVPSGPNNPMKEAHQEGEPSF